METNSSLQDPITNDELTTFYSRRSEVIMGASFIILAIVGKHTSNSSHYSTLISVCPCACLSVRPYVTLQNLLKVSTFSKLLSKDRCCASYNYFEITLQACTQEILCISAPW